MEQCYLGLGGNLGPVAETFRQALAHLEAHPQIDQVTASRFLSTVPIGEHAGQAYLNAAVALQTDLSPLALLDVLQEIERQLGRVRDIHWGPRTLDLDLLFFGNERIDVPRLMVPHPGAWYRRFVLDPLVELAPELQHPLKQLPIRELRARLLIQPMRVAVAGETVDFAAAVTELLQPRFPGVEFSLWRDDAVGESPTFVIWLSPTASPRAVGAESTEPGFLRLPRVPRIAIPAPTTAAAADWATQVLKAARGE